MIIGYESRVALMREYKINMSVLTDVLRHERAHYGRPPFCIRLWVDSQAWDSETLAAWIVGGRDKIKRLDQRLIRQDEGVLCLRCYFQEVVTQIHWMP